MREYSTHSVYECRIRTLVSQRQALSSNSSHVLMFCSIDTTQQSYASRWMRIVMHVTAAVKSIAAIKDDLVQYNSMRHSEQHVGMEIVALIMIVEEGLECV